MTLTRFSPAFIYQVGDTLGRVAQATSDAKLRQLMMSMSEAIRTIAYNVCTASCGGTACVNSFGDEQLAVDMLADKLLFEALRYSGCWSLPALRRCLSLWTWAARASALLSILSTARLL